MNGILRWSILLFVAVAAPAVFGQAPGRIPNPADEERREQLRQQQRSDDDLTRRMQDMATIEQRMRNQAPFRQNPQIEPELTKEQETRVRALRRVDPKIIETYQGLLDTGHAGVFNLFPDLGCILKNVIDVGDTCQQQVPYSNAFTFRTGQYGDSMYHDIWFEKDRLSIDSFFAQGMIASLGSRQLKEITVNDPAVKVLKSIPADSDPSTAARHAEEFVRGIESGGLTLSDSVLPEVGKTYILRVIAYRLANRLKPVGRDTTRNEFIFHSLDTDKRADIVIAFTVAAKTPEAGGLTVIWKELANDDAPKITFPKGQHFADFKDRRSPLPNALVIPVDPGN